MKVPTLPNPDPTRPWPTDRHGRLLPAAPVRGLRVESWGVGCAYLRYRVSHLNAQRFRIAGHGLPFDLPLSRWPDWLESLEPNQGRWITVHLSACTLVACHGCDGSAVGRSSAVPPSPKSSPGVPVNEMPAFQRDARLLRAARVVLKDYKLEAQGDGKFLVTGPNQPYRVTVSPEWSAAPRCTCPDNQRATTGGYCKHVIAVLLREPALRCQLLELFL